MAKENATKVNEPDYELAAKIMRTDIAGERDTVSKTQGNLSALWKRVDKEAGVQKGAAKAIFSLIGKSPAWQQDFLRSFFGMAKAFNLLNEAGTGPNLDLVDAMEAEDDDEVGENK